MEIKAKVTNPELVEVAITINMPLPDWKRLMGTLSVPPHSSDFPAWKVRDAISLVIRELDRTVTETITEHT